MTRSRGATAVVWVSVALLSLAGAVLTVMAMGDLNTSDTVTNLLAAPAAVLYATLGALIVRRAGNVIGWFLLGAGASLAIIASASAHAVLGMAGADLGVAAGVDLRRRAHAHGRLPDAIRRLKAGSIRGQVVITI